jgi:tellurite resistance protein TehA-like permease
MEALLLLISDVLLILFCIIFLIVGIVFILYKHNDYNKSAESTIDEFLNSK